MIMARDGHLIRECRYRKKNNNDDNNNDMNNVNVVKSEIREIVIMVSEM